MGDIYLGIVVLMVLAGGLFEMGRRMARRVSRLWTNAFALAVFAMLSIYIECLWDQVILAQWLPFSNVMVLGNWFPLMAGFLGGVTWEKSQRRTWGRLLSVASLQLVALFTMFLPLVGEAPACRNEWHTTGVCLQTTNKTCSPACAATLLKMHGIDATEQEMAKLCLTRDGTHWMGVYRGLKKKTAGTDWDVEAFVCSTGELSDHNEPAILCVGIPARGPFDSKYQTEWGWTPGVRHSVVLLGLTAHGRLADIAEPSQGIGREQWTTEELQLLFRGQGLRLVRRKNIR